MNLNELILNSFDLSPNQIKSTFWKNANFTNLTFLMCHNRDSSIFIFMIHTFFRVCKRKKNRVKKQVTFYRVQADWFWPNRIRGIIRPEKREKIEWPNEFILSTTDEFERFAQWEKIRKMQKIKIFEWNFKFFRLRLRELVNSEWTGLILGCKRYVN